MLHKYFTILIFGLMLWPCLSLAQKKEKKYKSATKRNLNTEQKASLLLEHAENILQSDPRSALDKVETALTASIIQKDGFSEGKCYLLIGKINQDIEEWGLALENYIIAYQKLGRNYSETSEFSAALEGVSTAAIAQGDSDRAIKYLNVQLEHLKDVEAIARTYLKIADTFFKLGELDSANVAWVRAADIVNKNHVNSLAVEVQAVRTKILVKTGKLEEAELLFNSNQQQINVNADSIRFDKNLFETSKEELLNAYDRLDQQDKAISLRNQSIVSNNLNGNVLEVAKEKRSLSEILFKTGDDFVAIQELEEAAYLSDSLNDHQEAANAYKSLAEAWNNLGNTELAVNAYQKYSRANDLAKEESSLRNLEKDGILKKQRDILTLSKELALDESQYELGISRSKLEISQVRLQSFIIYGLMCLLAAALIASWFIYRNGRRSKIRGQLLTLKSLRSQMNPHFIFNALNSVNQFIALNDERSANRYLSQFSKLMRLVLDHSQMDFIPLSAEKEILELYLKLEHNRFKDKFDYHFSIPDNLPLDTLELPPMLIQPSIENAIWHGLRYKDKKGKLDVRFEYENNLLEVVITDDGIGREKSAQLKTENQKKTSVNWVEKYSRADQYHQ